VRLDFRILWIDDQPKHVESFREGIDNKIRPLGFALEVQGVSKLSEVEDIIEQHVHDDGIDLVMVDYDLGTKAGDGGQEALTTIRASFPHKDIMFYSAADTDKLREIAFNAKVDGVHFSTRFSLVDDTSSYIENMLRKVMDIDHMRGIVMAATSDIDWLVERTLVAVNDSLLAEESAKMAAELGAVVQKKLEKNKETLAKALEKGGLEPLLKLKHLVTAHDRLEYLVKTMKAVAEGSENSKLDLAVKYKDEVVQRRNKLAHVVSRRVDGKQVFEGPNGEITAQDMTELRCDLLKHRANFNDVAVIYDVALDD
jgi:DNA-binding NarL/FixJ family response regulator